MTQKTQIDKTAFSVTPLQSLDEKDYWLKQTPEARLRHIEVLRRINYGNRASERLQRVFEVIQLKKNKKAAGRYKDLDDLEHLP
jgi:hypothetical protein